MGVIFIKLKLIPKNNLKGLTKTKMWVGPSSGSCPGGIDRDPYDPHSRQKVVVAGVEASTKLCGSRESGDCSLRKDQGGLSRPGGVLWVWILIGNTVQR